MPDVVIYAQGRQEHAAAAAAGILEERPGADVSIIQKSKRRAYREKTNERPDLFVLIITNEPAYLKPLDLLPAFWTMLSLRPKETRVLLYAWSGVYRLRDKAGEAMSRAMGLLARPFYLAGVRLAHAAAAALPGRSASGPGKVKKALVISLDMLGDLVWAAPAITSVKKNFPQVKVDLLVHPHNVSVARMIEGVDEVITYDAPWLHRIHHPRGGPRSQGGWANLLTRIRLARTGYGLTVEFRGEPRDHVLALTTGAPFRAGLVGKAAGVIRAEDTEYLLTHKVKGAFSEESTHILERNLQVTASLGIPPYKPASWLSPDRPTAEGVRMLLGLMGVTGKGPLVGMQPGASRPEKRWPVERFSEVARALMERFGAEVVVAGSAGEAALGEHIAANAPGSVNICGMTDIPDFAALVGMCDLFIANETSAISIASATGTPVVCMMSGVPELYGPWGVRSAVLQSRPDCYNPVGEHCFCAYGYRCLRDIAPAEVVDAAARMLGSARP